MFGFWQHTLTPSTVTSSTTLTWKLQERRKVLMERFQAVEVPPVALPSSADTDPLSWSCITTAPSFSGSSSIQSDFLEYEKEPAILKDADTLELWKAREHMFPGLTRMAREYLAIPASTASVERLFSKTGAFCSIRRVALTSEHHEALCFL